MNIEMTPEEIEDEKRIKIFKVLSDPSRLKLLRLFLEKRGTEVGCAICNEMAPFGASTLSYHLKMMQDAELVYSRKVGKEKFVTLRQDTFDKYLPNFLETL